MKETGLIFKAPLVRAILEGRKTQTRRVAKPVKHPDLGNLYAPGALVMEREPQHVINRACPYGQPGDRLWVRETFARIDGQTRPWIETDYQATYTHGDRLGDTLGIKKRWTPSIHMPRHASRITLEVTGVRVETLGVISHEDALAEGVSSIEEYKALWININGAWLPETWVWVLDFKGLP